MASFSENFLREFFELYKEQECLWQIKGKTYHDRNARKQAMGILVLKFQEVNKDANEEYVRKKINNFRTSYKRELKLVLQSSKSGAGTDEIYKPKLWYFPLLSFLNDQDVPRRAISNLSDEEEVTNLSSPIGDDNFSPITADNEDSQLSQDSTLSVSSATPSSTKTSSMKKKRLRAATDPRDELLITINEKLQQSTPVVQREKDRFDIFGDNVAVKLRGLPNSQRIMAEKLINDVLFEAESDVLCRGWRLQPPSSIPSVTNNSRIQDNYFGSTATGNTYVQLEAHNVGQNNPLYSASELFSTFNDNNNN
ncbi:uncharacterized protein [Diabrotica undecimpunctata]|uniref:uncharacterized protein n=1 Tax=Diabrotica undecimpunctata TaxID=50387 RepID=UPI003B631C1F